MIEELIEDHDYWVVKVDNVFNPGIKELRIVVDAMKAHKAKSIMPKKKNELIDPEVL